MNDGNAKQQIIDKIKSSSNILVTVSANPSVDELSAALGMTLLLNKMNKHATAVFSGAIPPAITFLDPQKTFENTVDSLRDFIIALDKEKADHLRYKVDGDVVKIFITPYRTTITGDDLEFSQGDYNVELVLALGVKNRDSLDVALAAHGRILHDAAVVTVSVGDNKSELGSLDWYEQNASSLSEMLVNLSDGLKTDKSLVDEQIATAFLTGIVAATDRFSNNHTSSRVMTTAAQLMAAGANQQLIASKLEEANEIGDKASSNGNSGANLDGTTDLSEGQSTKVNKKTTAAPKQEVQKPKKDDGSLTIAHEEQDSAPSKGEPSSEEDLQKAPVSPRDEVEKQAEEVVMNEQREAAKQAEQNLADQLATKVPSSIQATTPSVADLQKDLAIANAEVAQAAEQSPSTAPVVGTATTDSWQGSDQAPSMGGTLNATTEQAAEDARQAVENDRNHTILSHNGSEYIGDRGDMSPAFQSPLNASTMTSSDEPASIDPFSQSQQSAPAIDSTQPTSYAQPVQPLPPTTTLADLDKQNRAPHEEARAAVDAALNAVPFSPAGNPEIGLGAQPLGTVPHEESQPTGFPPLPDFSTLPPLPPAPQFDSPRGALPPEKLEDMLGSAPAQPASPQPVDPAQFKIPGQS